MKIKNIWTPVVLPSVSSWPLKELKELLLVTKCCLKVVIMGVFWGFRLFWRGHSFGSIYWKPLLHIHEGELRNFEHFPVDLHIYLKDYEGDCASEASKLVLKSNGRVQPTMNFRSACNGTFLEGTHNFIFNVYMNFIVVLAAKQMY